MTDFDIEYPYEHRTGTVSVEDYAHDIICIVVDHSTVTTKEAEELWISLNPTAVVPELTELERYRIAYHAVDLHTYADELMGHNDGWPRIFTATSEEIEYYNKFKDVFGEVDTY